MFDQVRPVAGDDPVVLRPSAGVAWVWVVLAAHARGVAAPEPPTGSALHDRFAEVRDRLVAAGQDVADRLPKRRKQAQRPTPEADTRPTKRFDTSPN